MKHSGLARGAFLLFCAVWAADGRADDPRPVLFTQRQVAEIREAIDRGESPWKEIRDVFRDQARGIGSTSEVNRPWTLSLADIETNYRGGQWWTAGQNAFRCALDVMMTGTASSADKAIVRLSSLRTFIDPSYVGGGHDEYQEEIDLSILLTNTAYAYDLVRDRMAPAEAAALEEWLGRVGETLVRHHQDWVVKNKDHAGNNIKMWGDSALGIIGCAARRWDLFAYAVDGEENTKAGYPLSYDGLLRNAIVEKDTPYGRYLLMDHYRSSPESFGYQMHHYVPAANLIAAAQKALRIDLGRRAGPADPPDGEGCDDGDGLHHWGQVSRRLEDMLMMDTFLPEHCEWRTWSNGRWIFSPDDQHLYNTHLTRLAPSIGFFRNRDSQRVLDRILWFAKNGFKDENGKTKAEAYTWYKGFALPLFDAARHGLRETGSVSADLHYLGDWREVTVKLRVPDLDGELLLETRASPTQDPGVQKLFIPQLPAGAYRMVVEGPGCRSVGAAFDLSAGQDRILADPLVLGPADGACSVTPRYDYRNGHRRRDNTRIVFTYVDANGWRKFPKIRELSVRVAGGGSVDMLEHLNLFQVQSTGNSLRLTLDVSGLEGDYDAAAWTVEDADTKKLYRDWSFWPVR